MEAAQQKIARIRAAAFDENLCGSIGYSQQLPIWPSINNARVRSGADRRSINIFGVPFQIPEAAADRACFSHELVPVKKTDSRIPATRSLRVSVHSSKREGIDFVAVRSA